MPSVDINTATREALAGVNGIGEVLAAAIVEYRDAHGPFQSVDDLLSSGSMPTTSAATCRSAVTPTRISKAWRAS